MHYSFNCYIHLSPLLHVASVSYKHYNVKIFEPTLPFCNNVLSEVPSKHLEYFQPLPLPFPPVRTDVGLIIDGPLPYWLLTALVRFYKEADVPWIAVYYPPSTKAIVVYSRVEANRPGDRIPTPA